MRLELLDARSNALTGRCGRADGVVGGELAISLEIPFGQQNVTGTQRKQLFGFIDSATSERERRACGFVYSRSAFRSK